MTIDSTKKLDAMKAAITALSPLDPNDRASALRWIAEELEVTGSLQSTGTSLPGSLVNRSAGIPGITDEQKSMTPKQFMAIKKPTTDVERIACLAYYITHYRDTPHFKTKDLTALNIDAAGSKFGNASQAANNALNQNGFIAAAGKGTRQITVRGEAFVEALPDREKAAAVLAEHPKRKRRAAPGGRRKAAGAKPAARAGGRRRASAKT